MGSASTPIRGHWTAPIHSHAVVELEQAVPDSLTHELRHAGRLEGVAVKVGNLVSGGCWGHAREGGRLSAPSARRVTLPPPVQSAAFVAGQEFRGKEVGG